ncbi:MAG TPA: DUF1598 domain-containing protein [Pirellulales bacterium]|nr:DUF1598 domain-containing protein [Pirellulales bacterium]
MGLRQILRSVMPAVVAGLAWCAMPESASAQLFTPNAGVMVDGKGVLSTVTVPDPTGEQMRKRIEAAKVDLNPEVAHKSTSRKISLNRLEKALAKHLATGRKPTDEMRYLAGLTRVQNIFLYPESGDIVIAGPAEGWVPDLTGRVIGVHTGRPIIELEDLAVAIRAFPPGGQAERMIGCSIDATPEGLARMQNFLRSIGTGADPSNPNYTQFIVDGLRTSLGLQKVRVDGVPPDTHFAQVMVEADYRMKLIGIGLEKPPVKITSYVDRADPSQVSRNAMQRWWFVPDYKCVRVSEDGQAAELVGGGVKLMNEEEVVTADGQRHTATTQGNRASNLFVTGFTQKYPELSSKSQVFGQLRNLIDLVIASAYMQEHDYYGKADWKATLLLSEDKFPVQTYQAPVEVETAVNSKWKGNRLMTPVGGGVSIHANQALAADNLLTDDGGKVQKQRDQIDLKQLADGQWWWD